MGRGKFRNLNKLTCHAAVALVLLADIALACEPGRVELRGPWGQAAFSVEVADDAAERAVGLMNREHLGRLSGMLFIYEHPQEAVFWMRNTLIPLDMLFLDDAGVVTHIHENAIPLDESPIPGGKDVRAVLEVNGGLARQFGITVGSELRHPGLDPETSVWRCGS